MEAFTRKAAGGGWKACVRFPKARECIERVLDGAYLRRQEALEAAEKFARLVGQLERSR
jgi:hypothetical protein